MDSEESGVLMLFLLIGFSFIFMLKLSINVLFRMFVQSLVESGKLPPSSNSVAGTLFFLQKTLRQLKFLV